MLGKLGKERGLISYSTLNDYNVNVAVSQRSGKLIDPRNVRGAGGDNFSIKQAIAAGVWNVEIFAQIKERPVFDYRARLIIDPEQKT